MGPSPAPADDRPPASGGGLVWLGLRIVPLALLATFFAVSLPGLDLRGSDRVSFPLLGLGLPLAASVLWLLRRRWPDQETLASAARLVTIITVIAVLGLLLGAGAE